MATVEQLKSINKIVDKTKVCMMSTMDESKMMRSRPMYTAQHDDENNFWFFTDKTSEKVEEINNNDMHMLTYANADDNEYLYLNGTIELVDDQEKVEEIFSLMTKAWFPEGASSDNLQLLKFVPKEAEIWDTKENKIVQLFKLGKALIAGERIEYNEESHAQVVLN